MVPFVMTPSGVLRRDNVALPLESPHGEVAND
jgi:hypothetical protein